MKIFLFPIFGGFTTVAGILAGYIGSLYVTEIKDSLFIIYHPAWFGWESVGFDGKSTLFWLISAFAGLSLSATFWAQTKTADETHHALKNSLNRLMTLPPEDFLLTYSDFMILSNSITRDLPSPATLLQVEQAIRVQLSSICNICASFDSNGRRTRFAANVMNFIREGSPKFITHQTTLQAQTRCLETAVSIANLRGVLRLELNLSATHESNSPDSNLTAMSLPVPIDIGNPLIYIPGAPLAFFIGNPQVYQNQSDLIDQVENNRQFSLTVLNDLKSLLGGQNDHVKCLMCIPLFSDANLGPASVIGVLNIHKSMDDEYIEQKMQELKPLLAPLLRNLEILLWLLP